MTTSPRLGYENSGNEDIAESLPAESEGDPTPLELDAPEVRRSGKPRSVRQRAVTALLVVILIGSAVVAGLAAWHAREAGRMADARADALEAARTRVPVLLSYDATTLEADLDLAVEQTTGEFHDDYRKVLDEVVAPTASREGISTQAEVTAAGVVSARTDEVVVLVFLTQSTTATDQRSSVTGSRVEVTMERTTGGWKVAGLDPR